MVVHCQTVSWSRFFRIPRHHGGDLGRAQRQSVIAEIDGSYASCVSSAVQHEGEHYDVEAVLGEKIGPGMHECLIQRVDYDEPTWTTAQDCSCKKLIAKFRASRAGRALDGHTTNERPRDRRSSDDRVRQNSSKGEETRISKGEIPPGHNTRSGKFRKDYIPGDEPAVKRRPDHDEISESEEIETVLPRNLRANNARFSLP